MRAFFIISYFNGYLYLKYTITLCQRLVFCLKIFFLYFCHTPRFRATLIYNDTFILSV